jgi:hypothetical protein
MALYFEEHSKDLPRGTTLWRAVDEELGKVQRSTATFSYRYLKDVITPSFKL